MGGTNYSDKDCFEKAVALDPKCVAAWHTLGSIGGGTWQGKPHSKGECFQKVLALDPQDAQAWYALGTVGGGIVNGTRFSQIDSFQQAGHDVNTSANSL